MNNSNNSNVTPNTSMSASSLAMDGVLPAAGVGGAVGVLTGGSTRRTSRVWRYFGMVDNCHYICRLCSFVGAYTNTTNMRKHIQHHHPERFQDILDHTRPTSRPYFAGSLPRLRQPLQYPQHNPAHHYPPGLLYPPPMPSKRVMLSKPTEMPFLQGDTRSDSDLALSVSSHDCSVAAAAQAAGATCQSSLQEAVGNNSSYTSLMSHTAAATLDVPVSLCEMSPEENKQLVKQLLPALTEATDSSTDADTPSRGLPAVEDRSGSEFSHHNSGGDEPIPVSPEHFLSEGTEQDEPAPVPPTPSQQQKPESYQLRHNNHLTIVLEALARDESFMDVTLTAQGRSLKAHKVVCVVGVSSYFRGVLRDNPCQHPIIIMPRDVRFEELYSIVNYIYKGEMTVAAEDLTSLLKTAEILQVSGLAPSDSTATVNPQTESLPMGEEVESEGEEGKEERKRLCSQPPGPQQAPQCSQPPGGQRAPQCSQPPQCSQTATDAKDDDDAPDDVILGFPSPYEQSFDQPMPSTSSHEAEFRSLGVKSDPEKGFNSQATKFPDNPQPLKCPHCDEQYHTAESIECHLRLKHPTKPSFICKCGRIFTRQIHHQAHTRMCSNAS
ncbi:Protein bric-a-brac 2 [Chionoecetes opilio]|uniref:Protein bric-a-brac 2 n=1 Tax=Chionoecetes opilio TaxID=41210 RepID=A0A8J5C4C5_CHIOP|nr:Protein bric-a-brac 2 [Chionoecetes opilio]